MTERNYGKVKKEERNTERRALFHNAPDCVVPMLGAKYIMSSVFFVVISLFALLF